MDVHEILRTKALSVGYGKQKIVEDVSFSARPGEIICLIAPNGEGKSTLLKTLLRQLPPLAGAVWVDDLPLTHVKEEEFAKSCAAVLTQRVNPEMMRCEEVIATGRYPYTGRLGILSTHDRRIVEEIIQLVGIESIRQQVFNQISDGQRQRIMLARALCQEPKLLLMDEPTSFLDLYNKLEFLHLLRSLVREKQLAVVMSLHELDLAQKYADTIICLKSGRIDRCGPPEEIFSGNYIEELYGVKNGSYNALFGSAEPCSVTGDPEIFVLGGGGTGIPVFRRLQRAGIPFATGVLQENDLDYPVARALSATVIAERAFEPVSDGKLSEALSVFHQCRGMICTLSRFGSVNQKNRLLLEEAKRSNRLLTVNQLVSDQTA